MTPRMRRAGSPGLIILILALAGAVLAAASSPRSLSDDEVKSAKAVVRAAIVDTMDVGTFKDATWKTGPMKRSAVADLHAAVRPELEKHMGGKALETWAAAIEESVVRDSDGEHLVTTGGGVSKISYDSVESSGNDTVVVTGRALQFSTWVIKKADWDGARGGRAENWVRFTATVTMGRHPLVIALDTPFEAAP